MEEQEKVIRLENIQLMQRIQKMEKEIGFLNHNLDEALILINQIQQAVLENDVKLSNAHNGTAKLAQALLHFWQEYEVPSVK